MKYPIFNVHKYHENIDTFWSYARSCSPAESTDARLRDERALNGARAKLLVFGNVIPILMADPIHLTPKDTHGNITKCMHNLCTAHSQCLKTPMVKSKYHSKPANTNHHHHVWQNVIDSALQCYRVDHTCLRQQKQRYWCH